MSRAALPGMIITAHARLRYRQRIAPGADDREARVVLAAASRRAVRQEERTIHGNPTWRVDDPPMVLVTKHDPACGCVVVTVLTLADWAMVAELMTWAP